MFEDSINFDSLANYYSINEVMFGLILAFALSFLVALVYQKTHKGFSYSQSFTFTLVLIGMLISVIMMVIGNSVARAFGAFGAFSLIRFRTAIKDSKDVAFILLVVAIGLACGTKNYLIAVILTLFSVLVIYSLTRFNFGSIRKYDYILKFSAYSDKFSNETLRRVFDDFLTNDNLLNVTSRDSGKILDYSFNIKFTKQASTEQFINKLNQIEGVYDVDIISAKNDIEY